MIFCCIFAMLWPSRDAFFVMPLAGDDVMDQRADWFRFVLLTLPGKIWSFINRNPDTASLEDHFFHTFMDESLKNMGTVRYRWFSSMIFIFLSCDLVKTTLQLANISWIIFYWIFLLILIIIIQVNILIIQFAEDCRKWRFLLIRCARS